MSIVFSHKCEDCGGELELINGYARCKACWLVDKTYEKAKLLMKKKEVRKMKITWDGVGKITEGIACMLIFLMLFIVNSMFILVTVEQQAAKIAEFESAQMALWSVGIFAWLFLVPFGITTAVFFGIKNRWSSKCE